MTENISKESKTVIAITKEETRFKAVCLASAAGKLEVVWTKQSEAREEDWSSFSQRCGLEKQTRAGGASGNGSSIFGFDSIGVIFYHLDVPATKADEVDKIVRLQTEVKLPLAADQIELSYKALALRNGHTPVIVAAARRQSLLNFVDLVKQFKPSKIVLDYEAIAKVWSKFFGRSQQNAVVVNMTGSSTRICLVEDGLLSNAAAIGVGFEDFRVEGGTVSAISKEIFVQDLRNVLDLFGVKSDSGISVNFLTCGDQTEKQRNESVLIKALVSFMSENGLAAKTADLCEAFSAQIATNNPAELYDYRMPIGLALAGVDEDQTIGLFNGLYSSVAKEQKKPFMSTFRAAGIAAALMAVFAVSFFYLLDVAAAKRLEALKEKMDFDILVEKQSLTEVIAGSRPDVLELLSITTNAGGGGGRGGNVGGGGGVVLDSLDFKKGQPVKITGTVQNTTELYQFQEALAAKNEFKEVKIQSAPEDSRTRRLRFTITFNYKDWASKKL